MKNEQVRKGAGFLWSTRGISLVISYTVAGYLVYYCTNHLGLSAGIVGTLILIGKIIDAISNFVIAYIVDNFNSPKGKGRPFEWALVPMWICVWLYYIIPTSWTSIAQYIYIFIVYNLTNAVFVTFLSCIDVVYLNHAFKSEKVRTKISTWNGITQIIAMALATIAMPVLVENFENRPNGWPILVGIVTVPCVIFGMIRYFTIPEVDVEETNSAAEKITIADTFKGLTSNKYVVIVALICFCVNCMNVFSNTGGTYYFTYIVGSLSAQSVINAVSLASIITLPVCLMVAERIGKINMLKIVSAISLVGYALRIVAGSNMLLLGVSGFLSYVVTYPFTIYTTLMLIDAMDFGEWKNGKRLEGAIFAGYSLGSTIGNGIGNSLCGIVLDVFGFDGMAATQSVLALFGIKFAYSIIPTILIVVVLLMYCIDDLDKRMPTIKQDLLEKNQNA